MRVVIVGAGGFARETICWVEDARTRYGQDWQIDGYIADVNFPGLPEAYGLSRLGGIDDFVAAPGQLCLLAIADCAGKQGIAERMKKNGNRFASFVHPSAHVAKTASIGEGSIVCPCAVVSADGHIDKFVTVNCHASIGHDARVGQYSTLSAHVDLTGGVIVDEGTFFGTGAKVMPGLKVGRGAKVGAGSTVMRSVPEAATVFTTPAKRLV